MFCIIPVNKASLVFAQKNLILARVVPDMSIKDTLVLTGAVAIVSVVATVVAVDSFEAWKRERLRQRKQKEEQRKLFYAQIARRVKLTLVGAGVGIITVVLLKQQWRAMFGSATDSGVTVAVPAA
jgi:hypothetical protein